jgi:hypothetical protein
MTEFGEVLKSLFAKIGDFFDILDLSFLISGAAVLGAIWFLADSFGLSWPSFFGGAITLLALFFISYWSGMICFAIGRWIRTHLILTNRNFDKNFKSILESHGLTNQEPYKSYLARDGRGLKSLYNRMWAELREAKHLTNSMSLCRRYWVLAATYDGVAFAAVVWMAVIAFWKFGVLPLLPLSWQSFILLETIFGLAFYACLREAGRCKMHQIEELTASLALPRE